MPKLKNIVIGGLACILVGTGCYNFGKNVWEQGKRERLYREVSILVDDLGDGNRVRTHEEWAPVYEELGIEYTGKMGMDLSDDQLRKYLEEQK